MRKIIQFFIERPLWTNAAIVIILLFGGWSAANLNRSFFPELDPNRIVISVAYPGASPDEMEEGVSIKIEQAIKGLQDIEHIDVISQENIAQLTIEAYQDADMEELLNEVENAVNSINSFPQGAEKPIIRRLKAGTMSSNVAFVGVTLKNPESQSKLDLTEIANKVESDLLATKVITQIILQGFPEKEISIEVSEDNLLRYGILIDEIATAVNLRNVDITAGTIRGDLQESNIRSISRSSEVDDIGNIILRTTPSGQKIKIKDVADVRLTYAEGSQESTFNNRPSISFQIQKTTDEDIAAISEALQKYKAEFNKNNEDFSFEIYFEFNEMLKDRISLLTENGLFGLILVLLALGLFLNIKLSSWVAFGIPFSFLGMFIFGYWYGMTINMISLFGMILVVGILVDDGIVIAENIYSHFEKGKTAAKAAIDGTMEVLPSVFTSILTTILAFSVLLFVEGLEMMREMAFVVISCLAFSLFEAFFILPSHLASKKVLNKEPKIKYPTWLGLVLVIFALIIIYYGSSLFIHAQDFITTLFPFLVILLGFIAFYSGYTASKLEGIVRNQTEKLIYWLRDLFFHDTVSALSSERSILFKGLTVRRIAFFVPMIFTISTIMLLVNGKIGATFFPSIPPDFFNIEVAFTPGDNKQKTADFMNTASQILYEENQRIIEESGDTLLSYFTSTLGSTMNLGQAGNHAGMLNVYYNGENTDTPVDTLINRIIRRVNATPSGKLAKAFFVGGFNRFGADIEFGLSSENNKELEMAKKYFMDELAKKEGIQNIKDNSPPGRSEIHLELLPQAEFYGLSKSAVLGQIRNGFFGREAQRLIIGKDEVRVWVRYPKEDRNSIESLRNMRIKTASGKAVSLKNIAKIDITRSPESLKRRDGERQIKVDATSIFPDSVAKYNTDISEEIIPKASQLFPSVEFTKMGQFERSQKTGNSMAYITMIVLVVMVIVISLHFTSVFQAFLILLVIPAGIAGAILGHGIVGIPVSILSAFGMIALLGVLINDSVVFLDRYNQLILEGKNSREAAYESAMSRFRPILLTTITTVAGLLPLIAETSMQAQFLIPMAVSIAFGVLFGTLFILAFFPAAILFGNDVKKFFAWAWKGKVPPTKEIETALLNQKEIDEKRNE
jgi:multidrug efflux pump subunit AcrB